MISKPLEWTERVILDLIENGVEENINLDYKACDALSKKDQKKKEISKDVSAFANSAGGTIIYGVIEKDHKPIRIDEGYDPNEITKEWLEQIISSTIQRKISDVVITPIKLNNRREERFIYVVDIPQSFNAPHMAQDNRYYKRYNFQSMPMEDYEVRDITNRNRTPFLILNMNINLKEVEFDIYHSSNIDQEGNNNYLSRNLELELNIHNLSTVPAEYALIRLKFDPRLDVYAYYYKHEETIEGSDKIFSYAWSIPERMPIWHSVNFPVTDAPIIIKIPYSNRKENYKIFAELDSPYMDHKIFQNYISTKLISPSKMKVELV